MQGDLRIRLQQGGGGGVHICVMTRSHDSSICITCLTQSDVWIPILQGGGGQAHTCVMTHSHVRRGASMCEVPHTG